MVLAGFLLSKLEFSWTYFWLSFGSVGPNSAIDFSSSSKLETLSAELACSRNDTTFSGYLSGDPFSGLESSE